jgi:hypothetical protein
MSWPWSLLDIARTDDRKTIREAYARKLKALDPDAAPEAFMDLREARDAALSGEFLDAAPPAGDLAGELDDLLAEAPRVEAEFVDDPVERPQFSVEYDERDDQRFHRMVELFTAEGDLGDADAAELQRHLDALFADDRMADLGHFARVEIWLAELLAQRYPRAARLFPQVAERFEWNERAHELGIHPAIPWLVGAHEGQALVDDIRRRDHPYHREWTELVQGRVKGPLFFRAIDHGRMGNLIATVRRDFPWLEQDHWQADLVARWEKRIEGRDVKGPGVWTWIALVFFALAVIGRMADNGQSVRIIDEPAAGAYSQTDPDVAFATYVQARLPQAFADDRDPSRIQARNPKLYEQMEEVWALHKDRPAAFEAEMAEMIVDQYFTILGRLPAEQKLEEIAQRQILLGRIGGDASVCAKFLRKPGDFLNSPVNSNVVPQSYRYHMYAMVYDWLPQLPAAKPSLPWTPSDELLNKLASETGLSPVALRRALTDKRAPDGDVCAATQALYNRIPLIPESEAGAILSAILR